MALPTNLVGATFSTTDIGIGASVGTSPVTYTQASLLSDELIGGLLVGPTATVTVGSVSAPDVNGVQTVSLVLNSTNPLANGTTFTGTTVGVDNSDFAINSTVLGLPATIFVTNTPAQQPLVNATASVAGLSANVAFIPACYCTGTLIRTASGEAAVETLAVGDVVRTVDGRLEPIRWIGTRSYHGRFLAGHEDLLPVRFRAGSLGEGVPARDLLVSPKHAMLIDGVLVAAELLVNGCTIHRERGAKRVDYVHLELARHDAIWAEGAPSETFVDDESRGVFHNAASFGALYPDAVATVAEYCAPRVTGGFALDAIRRRLDALAGELALAS